jgi:hypothetical protein
VLRLLLLLLVVVVVHGSLLLEMRGLQGGGGGVQVGCAELVAACHERCDARGRERGARRRGLWVGKQLLRLLLLLREGVRVKCLLLLRSLRKQLLLLLWLLMYVCVCVLLLLLLLLGRYRQRQWRGPNASAAGAAAPSCQTSKQEG